MESNLFSKLTLLFCSLTFMSCNGGQTNEVNNDKLVLKREDVKLIQEPARNNLVLLTPLRLALKSLI